MAKAKGASLSSIFDDEPAAAAPEAIAPAIPASGKAQERVSAGEGGSPRRATVKRVTRDPGAVVAAASRPDRKDSHPGKKPVLIHIPEDMHRILRQLSVEEGGEPITQVTERGLRQYLVQRGYTKFAAT